ncbi:hypothetical protein AHF37_11154 [Paragonimus kellicotti]|nr:hypothetical protein AHF37_11154 [Paragonimus kellicotti]
MINDFRFATGEMLTSCIICLFAVLMNWIKGTQCLMRCSHFTLLLRAFLNERVLTFSDGLVSRSL